MIVLAVETATVEVGAALVADGQPFAVAATRPGRRHVETLHPAIAAVCSLAGVGLGDVDAIAVDVGPGLFTGLRVGIAAAKALSLALSVPVVACTSLDVLHHATRGVGGPVAAVVDMRRGEVAFSLRPREGQAGHVVLGSPELLAGALAESAEPVVVVGDGARRYRGVLADLVAEAGGPEPVDGGPELGAPPVVSLGVLAAERLAAGGGTPGATVEPVYLRPVDARINWTTRHDPAPAGAHPREAS